MKRHLLLVALFLFGTALAPTLTQAQPGRRPSSLRSTGQLPSMAVLIDEQESNNAARENDTKVIRFDVAENAKQFVFDETPLDEDGLPAYGNEFVTEGYIYPHGTLTIDNDGKVTGVNADGSPEFPHKVIGRWTCRGWHTGKGAKTVTGPWVVTHQVYDFGNQAGQRTLTTDGVELVDVGVAIKRAITGGTGPYARARGEAVQTMLGFNQLGGVGLRFTVNVVK